MWLGAEKKKCVVFIFMYTRVFMLSWQNVDENVNAWLALL